MGYLNIYVVSTFIGSVTYLALAFFVYFRVARRTPEVKRFILFCLGYSIYTMAIMLQFIMFRRNAPPPRGLLICMHISNTIGTCIPLLYADFLLTFVDRRPKLYWGVYGIVAIITPIFIWHERSHVLLEGRAHYYPPPFVVAPLSNILFFVTLAWGLISLRLAYRDTDSPIRRKMLRALFGASFLIIPAAVSDTAFMLRNIGIFPLSTLASLGYAIYFSYAIVKYRFLGIRVAIRKSIIYVLLMVPITTSFLLAAVMSYNLTFGAKAITDAGAKATGFSPLIILWALLVAIVFYLIRERLEIFIDRVMFKKSYQYQRSLERLDRDIMSEVDPGTLVSKLVVWLKEALKLEHANIYMLETNSLRSVIGEEEQYFTTVGSRGRVENRRIPEDSLLLKCFRERQEAIFRADLPVIPQFSEIYHELDKEFQMLSAEVCMPLATDRLLFGIGSKFQVDLDSNSISEELRQEFESNGISLSDSESVSVSTKENNRKWMITDKNNIQAYTVRKEEGGLNVYTGSKLSGVIVCGNKRHGKFEEEDRRLLGITAYSIAFAVERAQLVLELKSANQFKWDLVRWMSHDLNTPLTPIKMIVNALRRRVGGNAEDQQAISVVMGEITRLQSLISGLDFIADLDLGSPSTRISDSSNSPMRDKREAINLGNLIAEVVTLFEWQARESGITLSYQVPSGISPVYGDANRMKQALINLISNSMKYNNPGGQVEVTASQTDGDIVVSIRDTGIGMSELEEASIFEPFYRSDRAQAMGKRGVGLGLAIVKRIVEEHKGTIQVQSEVGVGTSIDIQLTAMG